MKFLVQGPFWPPLSTGDGRNGPTGFQKHFHTVCLGGTHPYHALGPLNGPLLHSRAPKTARFGPERPFWGSWRSSEGPRGPDLVPTAANWSDWVGVMVTTHFGLVLGLFWVPRGPKRTRFGPKCPFWGSWRSLEGLRGPDLVPTAANWSDWVGVMVTKHFGLVLGLFWVPRDTKRARLGPKCPFLAPKGPIWGQNSKLSQTYRVTYQNLREKGTQPMEKTSSQSGLPVERKFQKNYQLGSFAEMAKMHL